MPVRVHVPIRLRIDASELEGRDACIEEALGAAVERALENSQRRVLAPRGGYLGVRLAAPDIRWSGDALDQATPQQRARLEALVREVLERSARGGALGRHASAQDKRRPPLSAPPAERLDPRRMRVGHYRIPSYGDGGDEVATPADPADAGSGPTPDVTVRRAGRWQPQRVNWWRGVGADEWQLIAEDMFNLWSMQDASTGMHAVMWAQPDPDQMLGLYARNLPGGQDAYFPLTAYTTYRFVRADNGTGRFELQRYLPEPGPSVAEWWTMDQVRAYIRDGIETELREQSGAETQDAGALVEERQALVESEMTRRTAAGEGYADALMVSVSGAVNFFLFHPTYPRWTGLLPIATMSEARVVPIEAEEDGPVEDRLGLGETGETGEEAGSGTGGASGREGDGEGEDEGDGGSTGDGGGTGRRRGHPSGVEGGEGHGSGEGGFVFWGDDVEAHGGPGRRLPGGGSGGATLPRCHGAFNGEPSLDDLPVADARRLRGLIRDIAVRLEIEPCVYAGRFCLVAAQVLGMRAAGVAAFSQQPGNGRMLLSPRRTALGPGVINFMPTVSPAIQLLRHLAGVVPRITGLSQAIREIYGRNADLITGDRANHVIGWLLDFGAELHPVLKRSVAHHFVFTTSVVFLQLLDTSKNNIDARLSDRNFDAYAAFFEELVRGDLMSAQELQDLRDTLVAIAGSGSAARDIAGGVIGSWRAARGALLDVAEGRNPFANVGAGAGGQIVMGDNGVRGVRDAGGTIWTLQQLDRAIALRNDTAVNIDPLARQLTADPRIRERFTRDPANIRGELRTLLGEMQSANAEVTARVRDDVGYAFTLAPLDTDYTDENPQTLPGTGYVMQGVHLLAHQAVHEFFLRDTYYTFGVGAALDGEDGRRTFLTALEIGTIVMVSILCAPLGMVVGAGWSVYHEVVAGHHMDAYRALIDPDMVFRHAELEAEAFAADLGALLSFIPLGRYGARVGVGAGRRLLEGEVRAAVRYAARHVTRTLSLATLRALQNDLVVAFVTHLAAFEAISRAMGVMMTPIIEELARQQLTLDQLLELGREVEAA